MAVLSPVVITGSRITSNYGNSTVIFRKKDFEGRTRYSLSEHFITEEIVPVDRCNSVRRQRKTRKEEKRRKIAYTPRICSEKASQCTKKSYKI